MHLLPALLLPLGLLLATVVVLVWARRRGTLRGPWLQPQVLIALLLAVLVGLWAATALR